MREAAPVRATGDGDTSTARWCRAARASPARTTCASSTRSSTPRSERIILVSPYFVPDDSMLYADHDGRAVGPRTCELFVSEIGDQFLVYHAQRSYYEELLQAGVRIYLFPTPTILHAKHMTFDDEVAIIGSSNMDMRSFTLDLEISVMVRGEPFLTQLREVEDAYRAVSRELTLEEWQQRSFGTADGRQPDAPDRRAAVTAARAGVVVRAPQLADVPAMARVLVQSWRETYRGLMADAVLDRPGVRARARALLDGGAHRPALRAEPCGCRRARRAAGRRRDDGSAASSPARGIAQLYVLYVLRTAHGSVGRRRAPRPPSSIPAESAVLRVADPNPRAQVVLSSRGIRAATAPTATHDGHDGDPQWSARRVQRS